MTGIHHTESCNVFACRLLTEQKVLLWVAFLFLLITKYKEKPQTADNFWSQLALHSTLLEQELS